MKRLLLVVLALHAACQANDSIDHPAVDAGPIDDGILSPQEFLDQYKRVACGLVHGCCTASEVAVVMPWFGTTEAECLESEHFDISVVTMVNDGTAAFNQQAAKHCLAALSQRSCDEGIALKLSFGMDVFCSEALEGFAPPGSMCSDGRECSGNAFCAGPVDGVATCHRALADDEPCWSGGQAIGDCQWWQYCDAGRTNRCTEKLGLQQVCSVTHPQADLMCWPGLACRNDRCEFDDNGKPADACL
ncbi:MAG: hypothetical protein AB7P03_11830 [Kofleriaceae bacterium]